MSKRTNVEKLESTPFYKQFLIKKTKNKSERSITATSANAKAALNSYCKNNFCILQKNAFDQIKSFSVKSALDGAIYPKKKLIILVKYLEKREVNVYGTEGNPKFVGMWNGTAEIYLPANPTVLQVKHELSHYLDFKNLGVHEYVKLSRYDRERLVLERLQNNRLWSGLNDLERKFSINYVDSLKPKTNINKFEHE